MKITVKHNDSVWNKAKKLKNARLSVGWFETAKYDDNTAVGEVAAYQEYGTSTIPPRPFMRPAQKKNEDKWIALALSEIKKCVEKGIPLSYALSRLGLVVQGDIQQAITDVLTPKLKEATIKARMRRRGMSTKDIGSVPDTLKKPLVDTGTMLATVQSRSEDV